MRAALFYGPPSIYNLPIAGFDSGAFPTIFNAGGAERARIDNATGNASIGMTNGQARLNVASTSTTGKLRVQGSGTNNFYGELFKDNGTGEFRITQCDGGVGMTFWTGAVPAQRLNIDNTGNVLIDNTNGSFAKLTIGGIQNVASTDSVLAMTGWNNGADQFRQMMNHNSTGYAAIGTGANGGLIFGRAAGVAGGVSNVWGRFDTNGNLLVGLNSGTVHNIAKNVAEGNDILYVVGNPGVTFAVQYGAGQAWSTAKSVLFAGQNTTTLRSINAAGTINASGADYAEYMTKADECGTLAKGQIVGVDVNGKLTDKFDNAVSFLIKSTDPSYVGGDTWGSEESLGIPRPIEPAFEVPGFVEPAFNHPIRGEDESDESFGVRLAAEKEAYNVVLATEKKAYESRVIAEKDTFDNTVYRQYIKELAVFEAALEVARQKVDRIAYCGQVPVNVHNAKVGQYIVPERGPRGEINGLAILRRNMTLEYYMAAVGVVQNILPDGRANVRVKVV